MRICWTKRADCDLDAVAEYLEDDDSEATAGTVLRILDAVEYLADHPHLGRPGRIPDTRELVVSGTPYIVPYRIGGGVLQILHGAMRWPEAM